MIVTRKSLIDHEATPEKLAEARAVTKRGLVEMTPEEDAAITADAMADPDSGWMTDEEFAVAPRAPRPAAPRREEHEVRLDPDILAWLKAQDPNWQIRANAILRAALEAA